MSTLTEETCECGRNSAKISERKVTWVAKEGCYATDHDSKENSITDKELIR